MKMSVRAERDSCNTEVRRSGRRLDVPPPPVLVYGGRRTGVARTRSTRYTSTPYAQARRPLVYRSEDGFGKKLTNGRGRCQPGGGTCHIVPVARGQRHGVSRGYRGPDERERDERAMTRSRRAPIMAHAPAARSCCVLLRPAPPSAASHCGMLMCRRSVISPAVPQSFAKVQTPK
jgi:hypothetical protein